MTERERTRRVQESLARVLPVLNVEHAVLEAAFEVLDAIVYPTAMVNSETEPSLAFALHGRLDKALRDLETLREDLAEAAVLAPSAVRETYNRAFGKEGLPLTVASVLPFPRSANPGGRNRRR